MLLFGFSILPDIELGLRHTEEEIFSKQSRDLLCPFLYHQNGYFVSPVAQDILYFREFTGTLFFGYFPSGKYSKQYIITVEEIVYHLPDMAKTKKAMQIKKSCK